MSANAATPELNPAAEQAELMARISKSWQQLIAIYAQGGADFSQDMARLAAIWARCFQESWALWQARGPQHPSLQAFDANAWQQQLAARMAPAGGAVSGANPSTDKRFKSEHWNQGYYTLLRETYLMYAEHMFKALQPTNISEREQTEALRFFTRQAINAFSPSNFPLTNPDVWAEAQRTQGLSLLRGVAHYLEDTVRGGGRLNIRMTDLDAFTPGVNVAATPGAVVYQNDLIQLIQYTPTTEKVHKRPLLIIPPWINKFYILDLRPQNSLVRWAVAQGHTVFVISWVNPGAAHKDRGFDDYLTDGTLAAIAAVQKITGEKELNAMGYCLGGTLLASTLAYFAAQAEQQPKKKNPIARATYMATLIDFSEPGEIGVYIDEQQLDLLDAQMAKEGVFNGRNMATAFNSLRENDLIWSYWVNNYLLGKNPMAFDLLYWNCDATNLPSKMHSFYLRNMYLHNRFKDANGITLLDTPIDIRKIKTPVYFLSTEQDHIALWTATYKGALLHSGPVRFVLGGSGHIAGVINPDGSDKYGYQTNDELPKDPLLWQAEAKQHSGSWWRDWH
ncbi:class I poly(R)-hydroxyalkanoic acid synthase, partial [Permianibacter sp. IMCC34836]|uniref:PHA/PHB synthase family protein n=1 Tax=Permianibacter fluminis TaxID=2738515 RepID=UPI0015566643